MTNGPTKRQRQRADAIERAQKAWNARVMGATWEQAAQLAGYSDATAANRAVKHYFGTLPEVGNEGQRRLLDARHEVVWRQALRDLSDGKPGAVRAGVAVLRSHSQLLGTDAPNRVEFYRPGADEYMQVLAELRAAVTSGEAAEGDVFAEFVEDTDADQ